MHFFAKFFAYGTFFWDRIGQGHTHKPMSMTDKLFLGSTVRIRFKKLLNKKESQFKKEFLVTKNAVYSHSWFKIRKKFDIRKSFKGTKIFLISNSYCIQ